MLTRCFNVKVYYKFDRRRVTTMSRNHDAIDYVQLDDNIPILVGVGQHVLQEYPVEVENVQSPADLAAVAVKNALADAGIESAVAEIDTIVSVRLFSDSTPLWASPFGGSNNLPESIARRIGASPEHRIYSEVGGSQPLQLLAEMFQALAKNEKKLVLLSGVEAIGTQKFAQKNGLIPNWYEDHVDVDLEDRGHGQSFVDDTEIQNGLTIPIYYYSIIENMRAVNAGLSLEEHAEAMAKMWGPFSKRAAKNPYAQFPKAFTTQELLLEQTDNYRLTIPYTKRLVSQDAVNQSAALLLTNVGKAKSLKIDPAKWVFLHGYAEAFDAPVYLRPNVGRSVAMAKVIQETLKIADTSVADIDHFDIYSCFPCAVSSACEVLNLPTDGSVSLTQTGGLPFFGGPGNNYSMHGIAEMVNTLRRESDDYGLVTTNGGMLSKHAAGVFSCQPHGVSGKKIDWSTLFLSRFTAEDFPSCSPAVAPQKGKIISYTVIYARNVANQCIVIAENENGERFVAQSNEADVIIASQNSPPFGRNISVITNNNKKENHFIFCD
ncbi:MAG: acetyl-CoA C-acetyltransferase [Paraglaciecola sp.]|jgi:acetyl-CoA C-acetyltransferase